MFLITSDELRALAVAGAKRTLNNPDTQLSHELAELLNGRENDGTFEDSIKWWAEAEGRYAALYVEYFSNGYIVQSKK